MDIAEIIMDIERNTDDATERCISYAEIILHLQYIKKVYSFGDFYSDWKNDIGDQLKNEVHRSIDRKIDELKKMIKLNVTH